MATSNLNKIYTADFETTTNPLDLRVWVWGLYNLGSENFQYNNNLESFFNFIKFKIEDGSIIYFHNLKFDGEFMFCYMFKNGFNHTKEKKLKHREFSTLIDKMGTFYSIRVCWGTKVITFLDSLKLIPLKVSQIPKAFNLDILKGEIDYHKERSINYEPTIEEIKYLKHDVEIVGKALNFFFNQGLNKMTVASNSLKSYKKIITSKKFERCFPFLPDDEILRKSYKGGVTQVKEDLKGVDIGEGISLDVNSLYPSIMYYKKLPYGEPIYQEGKLDYDKFYDVGIQRLVCTFELKENHLPTVQIKKNFRFKDTEYLKSSDGEDVVLTLTSVDLELFLKHYDVFNVQYLEGWKFRSTDTLFKDYIDTWIKVKNESTLTGNEGMRTIAKLMLNSLYGKFGLNPITQSKIPNMDEEGYIHYKLCEQEEREPIYLPVASFITSYARQITIEAGQKNYKRFIYCDTDSIHLKGLEIPKNIEVDEVKLGAWKIEGKFIEARFLRAKSYIENEFLYPDEYEQLKENKKSYWNYDNKRNIYTKLNVKCAGLPEQCKDKVTFENFKAGLRISGKLQQKRTIGGVYLKEIDFTIEE